MPTYEYVCDSCNHEFELFQSMSEPHVKKCPECNKNHVRRLLGVGAGIIFKGSGFYETDYKRKETNGANKSSSEKTGGESSSDSKNNTNTKGDSKSTTSSSETSSKTKESSNSVATST